jgi:hypothetical protein
MQIDLTAGITCGKLGRELGYRLETRDDRQVSGP